MPPIDRREYLKYTGILASAPAAYSSTVRARNKGNNGTEQGRKPTTADKGPVGWETYRQLDRLPFLHGDDGVDTKEFSSFDRTGGNDKDGFEKTPHTCLRETDDGRCVIAEETGAGEIASLWFTRNGGDVSANGTITVELDGRTVVEAPLQDVVDGELDAPFAFPLVANADQSSGGVYIKVPMPFRERMRVVVDSVRFYRIVYRTFADAEGVDTFDPAEPARDVLDLLRDAGTRSPLPSPENASTTTTSFSLNPDETVTLDRQHGPGLISAFRLRIPQLVGPVDPRGQVTDDGRAFGANGSSEFTVAVDPDNDGVRLTRRFGGGVNNQHARILVDGEAVADWPGLSDTENTWVDQTVALPSSATTDTAEITVRNEFVSSNVDFNAFTYWVESRVDGDWVRTDTVDVGPNSAESETAHDYRITNQTWQGVRTKRYPREYDDDVFASSEILRDARIRMTFDGTRTVDAPLGEFFGSGLTEASVRALFFAMDTDEDGWYSSWWPMPYRRSATIELYNGSSEPISTGEAEVTASRSSEWARALSRNGDAGYFHATANRGETTPGRDWLFLDTAGRGKFVGVTHTMASNRRLTSTYLEGDERVYVDGSRYPQLHGTGTEDFYEGGWYFNRGPFTDPMNGHPFHERTTPLWEYDAKGCYRVMVPDEISFSSSLRFGIEHGPANDVSADYSSTAYWYGREQPTLERTDVLDVGDTTSENAHGYTSDAPGSVEELTSTFVGEFQTDEVTDDLRATGAPVEFTLSVDKPNSGVMLRRMADHEQDYQAARVLVAERNGNNGNGDQSDWKEVGVWQQPLSNETHRWIEDSFEVPAAVTAKAKRLGVRLEPLSGAPAWRAARYEAFVHTKPFTDGESPSKTTDLRATGVENTIQLSWDVASDNVGVAAYEVYASRDAGFEIDDATLVAEPSRVGFTHRELGLNETWHYRVRAVDQAGNTGSVSEQTSATTEASVRIEGESLYSSAEATAEVVYRDTTQFSADEWSDDAQLVFRPSGSPEHVTVTFDVPETGTYELSAAFTKSFDYGTHELSIDGESTGQSFDGYNAPPNALTRADPVSYGQFDLDAGEHTLTLTVTGKNAASNGYRAGLDFFELEAVE